MKKKEFVTYKGIKYYVKDSKLIIDGLGIENINEIIGLNTLTDLKYLNFSDNSIKKIENLENLINLEVLELSKNSITEIKGLEKLGNLERFEKYPSIL